MAEGYKNFVAGQALGETDLDDYLMSQTIMRFADGTARNTALSGILTEGLTAYLKDADAWVGYNGAAWVFLAHGNAQTAWEPVATQSGTAPTTVTNSTYHRQGKQITGRLQVSVTGAGATAANEVRVTLPAALAASTVNDVIGAGFIFDSSAGIKYRGLVVGAGVGFSSVKFLTLHSTSDGYLGATDFTAALATNDVISMQYQYEAASAST